MLRQDPRRFTLAALAYVLPTFPLGYLWHLNWFHSHDAQLDMYREQVLIPLGLGSMLIQALLYAGLYPRLFGTHNCLRGALGFGCSFGVLAWSLAVLPVAAKYRMASVSDFLVLETCFTLLQYLLVSPLIALAWRGPRVPRGA